MKTPLILIPLIGAAAGWLITTFLVKLLFWPPVQMRLPFGIVIRGLLPLKRDELKAGVREMVETQMLLAVAGETGLASDIMDRLTNTAAVAAREHVYQRTPAIIPNAVKTKVAALVEDFIRKELPKYADSLAKSKQQQDLAGQISRWIEVQIDSYDLTGLEYRLNRSRELLHLKAGAALLGFLAGLLQLLVVWAVTV